MPLFEVELQDGRKFQLESERQPTEAEIHEALGSFEQSQAQQQQAEAPPKTSAFGAFSRAAGGGVLPTAAAVGTELLLAPESLGASLLAIPPTMMAAYTAGKVQDKLIDKASPAYHALLESDQEQHPWASAAGRFISGAPFLRLTPGAVFTQPLKRSVATVALGAGTGAVFPLLEGRKPTKAELLEGAAFSLLYGRNRFSAPEVVQRQAPPAVETPLATETAAQPPIDVAATTETVDTPTTTATGTEPTPAPAPAPALTPVQQLHAQLKALAEGGKLTDDEIRAVHSNDVEGLEAAIRERQQAHDEAEQQAVAAGDAVGSKVEMRDVLPDSGDPFSGYVAKPTKTGIGINRGEFRKIINSLEPEQRKAYVESLISEEHIHKHVTGEDATGYWGTLTAAEKAAELRQYAGEGMWSLDELNAQRRANKQPEITEQMMGHEALRRRMQKILGDSPTEVAATAGREKWTVQTLDFLSSLVRRIREAFGTSASKTGKAIIERAQANLDAARSVVEEGAPGSIVRNDERYGVLDLHTGDIVHETTYDKRKIARSVADRRDEKYGGVRYRVGFLDGEHGLEATAKRIKASLDQSPGSIVRNEGKPFDEAADKEGEAQFIEDMRAMPASGIEEMLKEIKQKMGSTLGDIEFEGGAVLSREDADNILRWGVNELQRRGEQSFPGSIPRKKKDNTPDLFTAAPKQPDREINLPRGTGELALTKANPGEQRPAATELGAKAFTAADLEKATAQHIDREAKRIAEESAAGKAPKPITYNSFVHEMRRNYGDLKPGHLYEQYSKHLYNRLFSATGKELEALQHSLGVERRGEIPDAPKAQFLEQEADNPAARRRMREGKKLQTAQQRYRVGAIGIIARKLLADAADKAAARETRTSVAPEDIRYNGGENERPFFDVTSNDLKNPELLAKQLVADARRKNSDPQSLTKRVTALVDPKTGKVHLVSTYEHSRNGAMLRDPAVTAVKNHRALADILKRYRPVGSFLLDEPVRNFKQTFNTLGEYEAKLATDVRRANSDVVEAPRTEGEPEPVGSWEAGAKITDAEASAIVHHIFDESATFENADDVKASLTALKDDTNHQVLSGYRKLAQVIEAKNPDLTPEQVMEKLAETIYENHRQSKSLEDFISRTMETGGAKADETATAGTGTARPEKTGARELIHPDVERWRKLGIDRTRNVTDVPGRPDAKAPPVPEATTELRPLKMLDEAGREEVARQSRVENPARLPEVIYKQLANRKVPKKKYTMAFETLSDIENTTDPEAPGSIVRNIKDDVQALAHNFRVSIQNGQVGDRIARAYDDASNFPHIAARAWENGIRMQSANKPGNAAKAKFTDWERGNKAKLAAANPLVQSGALRAGGGIDTGLATVALNKFDAQVAIGRTKAEALLSSGSFRDRRLGKVYMRAVEQLESELRYARAHMTDPELLATAHRMKEGTEMIYNELKAKGYDVNFIKNYLPQRYDMSATDGHGIFTSPAIKGLNFRKPRVFETYYDAISEGPFIPATRDGASLVGHAINKGLSMIAKDEVLSAVKAMRTATGEPVAVDPKIVGTTAMPPNGSNYDIVPVGGKHLAVHPDFKSLVKNLFSESQIEDSAVGKAALHLSQFIKHNLLLGDFFHYGRMMYYGGSLMRQKMGYKAGLSALDYKESDLPQAVRKGLITQKQADWGMQPVQFGRRSITRRQLLHMSTQGATGFNIGRIQDALYKDVYNQLTPTSGPIKQAVAKLLDPTTGMYNRHLFDKLTRGLMAESLVTEFERQMKRNPTADPRVLLRDISRDLNNYYGNIGRQGWLKAKWQQDIARMVFLAPQWVEGLIKKEAIGYSRLSGLSKLTGQRKGKSFLGATGAGIGTGLLAMMGLTQAINLLSRGKPTWQNEESEHKLDAWVPPIGGREEGLWLSPMALFNEVTHDVYRLVESKPSVMDAMDQIAGNKASPLTRAAVIAATGHSMGSDQKFSSDSGRLKAMAGSLAPVPMTFGKWGQLAGHAVAPNVVPPVAPSALERQVYSTLGIKMEPQLTALQTMRQKGSEFMKHNGYVKETGWETVMNEDASFAKLRSQLKAGDEGGARKTYEALSRGRTMKEMIQSMKTWVKSPMTGNTKHEKEFLWSLTPHEQEIYSKAQMQRYDTLNQFFDFIVRQP